MPMHAWSTYGPVILSIKKSDAKDLVIGLQFAPLRFCWKLVVVALCRVSASVTSPTLSVFGLSVWLNSTHQSTKRNRVRLQQFFLKLTSVASLAPGINLHNSDTLEFYNGLTQTHELSKRTWDKQGIGSGPEMNRALGLDLGWTGHWDWTWDEQGVGSNSDTWELHNRTWDEQGIGSTLDTCEVHWTWDKHGIGTGPGMNRALVVTLTHGSYARGPGTKGALGIPQTHMRYTGPETNRALELDLGQTGHWQ
jgi:hypothetical protein